MHLIFYSHIKVRLVFFAFFFAFICQLSQAQQLTTSNLPIIIIDTNGNEIPGEPKIPGTMKVIDNASGVNNVSDTPNDYDGNIGIELRGSSSLWLFPKRNYGIELWTDPQVDTSAAVLGFPAEEDWVLHGPYSDKSLMRNYLTYQLYSYTGRYSTRSKLVEVVVNNSYQGVYVFLEKIKRDNNRVNIAKLNIDENSGDDLTGGYIIKLDKYDGSNSRGGWLSPHRTVPNNDSIWFQFEYPKGDDITSAQEDYIKSYMKAFQDVLRASGSADPIVGYPSMIDEGSFVDFALINELTRNVDGYRLSTFMYKDKDSKGGKLTLGPIWDFNLGFGNANYCDGWRTDGWAWDFNYVCPGDHWQIPFWWDRLMTHHRFVEKFHNRWVQLRQNEWSDSSISALIDSTALQLEEPAARNFQKWPTLGAYIWPNPDHMIGSTYEEEVAILKQWILERAQWMDQNIADRFNVISSLEEVNKNISIASYPNPFTNRLIIESKKPINGYSIIDLKGNTVYDSLVPSSSEIEIRTDHIASGIYTLRITLVDGNIESMRIVKR